MVPKSGPLSVVSRNWPHCSFACDIAKCRSIFKITVRLSGRDLS